MKNTLVCPDRYTILIRVMNHLGSIFGFCQELARYATGRAGEVRSNTMVGSLLIFQHQGDAASVSQCLDLVSVLNGKFLEFAFRNGYLRRRFDSLKYSLRTLENLVCELSFVVPSITGTITQENLLNQTKRVRVESESVKLSEDKDVLVTVQGVTSVSMSSDPTTPMSRQKVEPIVVPACTVNLEDLDRIRERLDAQVDINGSIVINTYFY